MTKDHLIFGIQGGKGSFNEEALLSFVKQEICFNDKDIKIKYLYTTEKVLKNLDQGNIDYGLFAIENSRAGLVQESIQAMARYKFKIFKEHKIKIRHFLMKKEDAQVSEIKTIMTHPQVLKQCRKTLSHKYKHFKLKTGQKDLIDSAKVAQLLASNKLPKTIAVMGSQVLAKFNNLDIIDKDLQDDKNNYTRFLIVEKSLEFK